MPGPFHDSTVATAKPVAIDDTNKWEQNADFWIEIIRGHRDRYRTGLTDAAVLDAIGPVEGQRILDAGCGEGYLSRELASRGASVLGVDSSVNLIEAAAALAGANTPSLAFSVNDVADLEVDSGIFDLVVCNHLLNDLPDPTDAIHEFARVLKPGGRLVILMLHPCFYGDRSTRSADRHELPTAAYFAPRKVTQRFNVDGLTSPAEVTSWHRPLEFYVQALGDASFCLSDLREPRPTPDQLRDDAWWRANFPKPLFLLLIGHLIDERD